MAASAGQADLPAGDRVYDCPLCALKNKIHSNGRSDLLIRRPRRCVSPARSSQLFFAARRVCVSGSTQCACRECGYAICLALGSHQLHNQHTGAARKRAVFMDRGWNLLDSIFFAVSFRPRVNKLMATLLPGRPL